MPNISMVKKVIQQVCAIDYIVSKHTFLLINQFIWGKNIWLMKISLEWGFWAVEKNTRTDLFLGCIYGF